MGFWVAAALFVASTVVSALLAPRPKDASASSLGDFQVPTAEEGRPVPLLLGTCKISGPNVTWWGHLGTSPIRRKSGMFSKTTVGYRYRLGMMLALTGPVDAITDILVGGKSLAASAAEGVEGASIVTRAGGNGVEFGIQLASRPGQWVCVPAPVPQGTIEPAHQGRQAVGALGDSAVVDFAGLGGQSLQFAPLVAQGVAASLPADAAQRAVQVLASKAPPLVRGLCATAAASCVAAGVGPLVLIGMIDAQGVAGRIGGGVVDVPATLFERALQAH